MNVEIKVLCEPEEDIEILATGIREHEKGDYKVALRCLLQAREYRGRIGDSMIRSWSGADQAESEAYYGQRRVYVAVAGGADIEDAIAAEDKRWREYAAAQIAKVASAAKIKRGPREGQSAIHHRWVSPDHFQTSAIHVRFMCKRALGENRP